MLMLLFSTGLGQVDLWQVFIPVLVCEIALPLVTLTLFRKFGLIKDIEITNRFERRLFFLVILLLHLLVVIAFWRLTDVALVWQIRLIAWLIELAGTIVTWFWKISVHLAVNSFAMSVVIFLFGWQWWPLMLLLPLIAWSRIILHKHTFWQTVAGAGLTLAVTGIGFLIL